MFLSEVLHGSAIESPEIFHLIDPKLRIRRIEEEIDIAQQVVERVFPPEYDAERVSLTFCLVQASLLREVLHNPTALQHSGLFTKKGGPKGNPYREIDFIGHDVLDQVIRRNRFPSRIYVEERGWVQYGESFGIVGVADPIDETSQIDRRNHVTSTGIVIVDRNGNFRTGVIASLVDREGMMIFDGRAYLWSYNEDTNKFMFVSHLPMAPMEDRPLRVATLSKRLPILAQTELIRDVGLGCVSQQSFGGYGVLSVAAGQLDILTDPFGQPFNEAFLWGVIGQKTGCQVVGSDGGDIDFLTPFLLAAKTEGPLDERISMAIGGPHVPKELLVASLQIVGNPL